MRRKSFDTNTLRRVFRKLSILKDLRLDTQKSDVYNRVRKKERTKMKTMMIYTIDGFQYVGCFSGNDVVEIMKNASQETGIDSQNLFPWSTVQTFWK